MTVEQHCQQKHLLRSKLSQPIVTINDIKPVKLHISHKRKFKKLYSLFAIDVVGNKEVMGPFQQPQNRFWRGQVIPICAGWLDRSTKTMQEKNTTLGERSGIWRPGDGGIKIPPLITTDKKGGAYPIMLQQFKHTIGIGVAIVCGNAKNTNSCETA